MFTVIVGENASGKTCYLNMLYNKYDCVYNRRAEEATIRPLDISLKSAVFLDSDDLQDATNPLEVGRIIDIMLRKSDILLLDEIDSTVDESDKHLVYKVAMLVSKMKPVYAVTHDEDNPTTPSSELLCYTFPSKYYFSGGFKELTVDCMM